jgi:uncharacterized RDD family membrane protein YckC
MKYSSVQKRAFAKFIDLMVVLFLGFLWKGGPGSILGFLYSLVADGMPFRSLQGQSLGKKLMRIRVLSGKGPARLKTSVIRNAPIGLVTFFMIIPVWGWILSLLIGIPLALIEISLLVRAERRQRLGDVMAESVVVDVVQGNNSNNPSFNSANSEYEPQVL